MSVNQHAHNTGEHCGAVCGESKPSGWHLAASYHHDRSLQWFPVTTWLTMWCSLVWHQKRLMIGHGCLVRYLTFLHENPAWIFLPFLTILQKVCRVLIERAHLGMSLAEIVKVTELPLATVKSCLLVLLQHNCAQAFRRPLPGVHTGRRGGR